MIVEVGKGREHARGVARQVHCARGQRGGRPAPGAQAAQAPRQHARALCGTTKGLGVIYKFPLRSMASAMRAGGAGAAAARPRCL